MNPYLKILMLAGLLAAAGAGFAQSDASWSAANLAAADQHVIPAYERLAGAAAELETRARDFCSNPREDSLAALRAGFHEAMDTWQGVEHIQFGPITYFNWNFRIHYWPDDNATGERQLAVLLADRDEGILASDRFARMSVGVQGFPALERLLFDPNALDRLREDDYRCRFVMTIARNIHEIATGVAQRWAGEYREVVADPGASSSFEGPGDLGISFLKSLLEPITKIRDQKLAPVLGDSFEAARARRAESWRSQRSLRNIEINLTALQSLFSGIEPGFSGVFEPEDAEAIDAAFETALALFDDLPESLVQALEDEGSYEQVVRLHAQVDALHEAFESGLKNTDLYLGFNSLDGD